MRADDYLQKFVDPLLWNKSPSDHHYTAAKLFSSDDEFLQRSPDFLAEEFFDWALRRAASPIRGNRKMPHEALAVRGFINGHDPLQWPH